MRSRAGTSRAAALLLPPDAGLKRLATDTLNHAEVAAIERGQFVRPEARLEGEPRAAVRVRAGDGSLVAMVEWRHDGLAPTKVLRRAPAAVGLK